MVRLAVNRQTGEKYAVKIVKRDNLPPADEEALLMEVRLVLLCSCRVLPFFTCKWFLSQRFLYIAATTHTYILNDTLKYFQVKILQNVKGHPNIVQMVDFFSEKDHYFLVLELMKGGELFDRIVAKQFYNEKEVCDMYYAYLSLTPRVLAANTS